MAVFHRSTTILCCIFLMCRTGHQTIASYSVNVDFQSSNYRCDRKFLSVALDSDIIKNQFHGFDFESKRFQTLARALSPCNLRIGGTYADFIEFKPNGDKSSQSEEGFDHANKKHSLDSGSLDHGLWDHSKTMTNYTMSGHHWDQLMKFTSDAQWDVMFDFNLFRWKDGLWDSTNAQELLKYSALRGYNLSAFQLGNEPNSFPYNFNITIPPATLVKDFQLLKDILVLYPQYSRNYLYGPDVTNLNRHSSSRKYLQDFVSAGGSKLVKEISLHHYYLNGHLAKVSQFYDVNVLDSFIEEITTGHLYAKGSPIRLTETSSCFGGGAPGLSNRYVAGFMWLDKLGLSAKYGVTSVFRQTVFGNYYSLISWTFDPYPDYYLSLLHKNLIEGPVFNATVKPFTKYLRVYAHCTRSSERYKKGAVTYTYLNVKNESTAISFGQFFDLPYDLYILTPGESDDLKSLYVKLNGEMLKMSGTSLPELKPKPHKGVINVPGLSFGFFVVPDAQVPLCMK